MTVRKNTRREVARTQDATKLTDRKISKDEAAKRFIEFLQRAERYNLYRPFLTTAREQAEGAVNVMVSDRKVSAADLEQKLLDLGTRLVAGRVESLTSLICSIKFLESSGYQQILNLLSFITESGMTISENVRNLVNCVNDKMINQFPALFCDLRSEVFDQVFREYLTYLEKLGELLVPEQETHKIRVLSRVIEHTANEAKRVAASGESAYKYLILIDTAEFHLGQTSARAQQTADEIVAVQLAEIRQRKNRIDEILALESEFARQVKPGQVNDVSVARGFNERCEAGIPEVEPLRERVQIVLSEIKLKVGETFATSANETVKDIVQKAEVILNCQENRLSLMRTIKN